MDNDDRALRPLTFDDFTGQEVAKENLRIYVNSAKHRGVPLDHLLFSGPPGLGKTTLAGIIANEMGAKIVVINAPSIRKKGELAAALTSLEKNDILFLDEIHSLDPKIEEILYPAMEDFKLEVVAGNKPLTIKLSPFTLIGATTRAGMLQRPLRDRFGVITEMKPYTDEELSSIVTRSARKLGFQCTSDGALDLSRRSRGTPRIANRLLRRVQDFMISSNQVVMDADIVSFTCERLGIDRLGLDPSMQSYMRVFSQRQNKPQALNTLVSILNESRDTVENTIEPFLFRLGFVEKTPKGRILTPEGLKHIQLM